MVAPQYAGPLERVNEVCWRIPRSYKSGMRVDGLIYADDQLMSAISKDPAAEQVANVAFLPGIQYASLAMPDIHWGYGFCIGGVCATDPEEGGVISPGGVGYDINCGVRLIRSNLFHDEIQPHLAGLVDALFQAVPTGTGHGGKYRFGHHDLRADGGWAAPLIQRGLSTQRDVEFTEGHGCLSGAAPGFRQRPGTGPRLRSVRFARLRQPFSRDPGCRSDLGRDSRHDAPTAARTDLCHDPLGLARLGLSGVRRCAAPVA